MAILTTPAVWVANAGLRAVTKLSLTGLPLLTRNLGIGADPQAIHVNQETSPWVLDRALNRALKLHPDTGVPTIIVTTGTEPRGICTDQFPYSAWITNFQDGTVTKVGGTTSNIVTYSVGNKPKGIACDRRGNIWVGNVTDDTISRFVGDNLIGLRLQTVDSPRPFELAPDFTTDWNEGVWIVSRAHDLLTKISSTSGKPTMTIAIGNAPSAITTTRSGSIWVGFDGTVNNIVRYSSVSGVPQGTFNVGDFPMGLAVDEDENIWVALFNEDKVAKLSSTGLPLGTFGVGFSPRISGDFTGDTSFPPFLRERTFNAQLLVYSVLEDHMYGLVRVIEVITQTFNGKLHVVDTITETFDGSLYINDEADSGGFSGSIYIDDTSDNTFAGAIQVSETVTDTFSGNFYIYDEADSGGFSGYLYLGNDSTISFDGATYLNDSVIGLFDGSVHIEVGRTEQFNGSIYIDDAAVDTFSGNIHVVDTVVVAFDGIINIYDTVSPPPSFDGQLKVIDLTFAQFNALLRVRLSNQVDYWGRIYLNSTYIVTFDAWLWVSEIVECNLHSDFRLHSASPAIGTASDGTYRGAYGPVFVRIGFYGTLKVEIADTPSLTGVLLISDANTESFNGSTTFYSATIAKISAKIRLYYRELYISNTTGDDTLGNGTFEKPFRTFEHTNSVALPGDRIIVISTGVNYHISNEIIPLVDNIWYDSYVPPCGLYPRIITTEYMPNMIRATGPDRNFYVTNLHFVVSYEADGITSILGGDDDVEIRVDHSVFETDHSLKVANVLVVTGHNWILDHCTIIRTHSVERSVLDNIYGEAVLARVFNTIFIDTFAQDIFQNGSTDTIPNDYNLHYHQTPTHEEYSTDGVTAPNLIGPHSFAKANNNINAGDLYFADYLQRDYRPVPGSIVIGTDSAGGTIGAYNVWQPCQHLFGRVVVVDVAINSFNASIVVVGSQKSNCSGIIRLFSVDSVTIEGAVHVCEVTDIGVNGQIFVHGVQTSSFNGRASVALTGSILTDPKLGITGRLRIFKSAINIIDGELRLNGDTVTQIIGHIEAFDCGTATISGRLIICEPHTYNISGICKIQSASQIGISAQLSLIDNSRAGYSGRICVAATTTVQGIGCLSVVDTIWNTFIGCCSTYSSDTVTCGGHLWIHNVDTLTFNGQSQVCRTQQSSYNGYIYGYAADQEAFDAVVAVVDTALIGFIGTINIASVESTTFTGTIRLWDTQIERYNACITVQDVAQAIYRGSVKIYKKQIAQYSGALFVRQTLINIFEGSILVYSTLRSDIIGQIYICETNSIQIYGKIYLYEVFNQVFNGITLVYDVIQQSFVGKLVLSNNTNVSILGRLSIMAQDSLSAYGYLTLYDNIDVTYTGYIQVVEAYEASFDSSVRVIATIGDALVATTPIPTFAGYIELYDAYCAQYNSILQVSNTSVAHALANLQVYKTQQDNFAGALTVYTNVIAYIDYDYGFAGALTVQDLYVTSCIGSISIFSNAVANITGTIGIYSQDQATLWGICTLWSTTEKSLHGNLSICNTAAQYMNGFITIAETQTALAFSILQIYDTSSKVYNGCLYVRDTAQNTFKARVNVAYAATILDPLDRVTTMVVNVIDADSYGDGYSYG